MDKRYTCWLSEDGVQKFKVERDYILCVKLPQLRNRTLTDGLDTTKERQDLLKRVLHINKRLNYNGNPNSRQSHQEITMKPIKVCLHKKNAYMLERNTDGQWFLDTTEINQEIALNELVEAVQDLGYWCQVAKDVLPNNQFELVQEASYSYHEE